MKISEAALLGLVQGIAEFLPISSSGHLAILHNLFNISDLESGHLFFDVMLHFGTLIAICFVYWKDIKAMASEMLELLGSGRRTDTRGRQYPAARMFIMIFFASLPLLVVPFVNDRVELLSGYSAFIGIELILTGCMLFVSDKMYQGIKTERSMRVGDALIVGLCQCVAVLPGISRSGATITGCIATGHSREYAVKFSLLLSIPAVLAAAVLELVDAIKAGIDVSLIPAYLTGMAVAAVSGVIAIALLRLIAKKTKFAGFAYYCWVVGVLTIILSMIF